MSIIYSQPLWAVIENIVNVGSNDVFLRVCECGCDPIRATIIRREVKVYKWERVWSLKEVWT